jgi:hypothetical protein
MALEDRSAEQAAAAGALVAACFVITESTLAYLCSHDDDVICPHFDVLYSAVKESAAAALIFLHETGPASKADENVEQANGSSEDTHALTSSAPAAGAPQESVARKESAAPETAAPSLKPATAAPTESSREVPAAVHALQAACARLVAAWLAEETDALTSLVCSALPAIVHVAKNNAALFVLLLPGLYMGLGDDDIRQALVECDFANVAAEVLAREAQHMEPAAIDMVCDVLGGLLDRAVVVATSALLHSLSSACTPETGWRVVALTLRARAVCVQRGQSVSQADDATLVRSAQALAFALSQPFLQQAGHAARVDATHEDENEGDNDDDFRVEELATALQDLAELLASGPPSSALTLPKKLELSLKAVAAQARGDWLHDAAWAVLTAREERH